MSMSRIKSAMIVYAIIGSISSGHWFANAYNSDKNDFITSNPVNSLIVGCFWPVYVSYTLFED